ncbi:alpha/beta fold hydrolase [Rossellomorea aquimaris]|uniref:Alpha/beta hydrolase n=1 Tax=Rossellomorea aquimaris TaxID=189382 RepID=A0A1J6W5H4_9BACI|nr:alpha/beta fold hydrolase [Rossellomorea aquimaris]OIU72810.1 alpha/beta hydrolase [Rossellomorea aquimaris]
MTIERVYFLHGFMGTGESHFLNQISNMKNDYECILIDLPGHGDAAVEATDDYFEDTLKYVVTQIKNKGKGFIIGLSLGASLAIHIALREPELVSGIVLTGYSPYIPEELKGVMEKQNEYFLNIEENDRDIATQFMSLHGEKWKATLEKVLHIMTFHYPVVTQAEIEQIKVPVLVLNGSSELHEVEAVTYLKQANLKFNAGLVPYAGHTANIEQPEIYNLLVRRFLEEKQG